MNALTQPLTDAVLDGRFRLLSHVITDAGGPLFDALDERTGEVVRLRQPAGPVDMRLLGVLHPRLAQPLVMSDSGGYIVYRDLGEQPTRFGADGRTALQRLRWGMGQLLPLFEALHAHGATHGALGPSSVWTDADGELRVMDLGLRSGASSDPRDDVHALAALLYTLAEGSAPRFDEGRAPWAPNLPAPLARALMHAMDPRPVFRPATAGELQRSLDEALVLLEGVASDVDPAGEPAGDTYGDTFGETFGETFGGALDRVAAPPDAARTARWVALAVAVAGLAAGVATAGVTGLLLLLAALPG